jgi:hypothetical protein
VRRFVSFASTIKSKLIGANLLDQRHKNLDDSTLLIIPVNS